MFIPSDQNNAYRQITSVFLCLLVNSVFRVTARDGVELNVDSHILTDLVNADLPLEWTPPHLRTGHLFYQEGIQNVSVPEGEKNSNVF